MLHLHLLVLYYMYINTSTVLYKWGVCPNKNTYFGPPSGRDKSIYQGAKGSANLALDGRSTRTVALLVQLTFNIKY